MLVEIVDIRGRTLLVNQDHVVWVFRGDSTTKIELSNGATITMRQSPKKVAMLLKMHEAKTESKSESSGRELEL